MHYSNGRAAKIGDLVRGKGYNIKHEIVGKLIAANPDATACNCTIATVTADTLWYKSVTHDGQTPDYASSQVIASFEYGQLDAFVAIDPNTGDALPA